MFNRLIEELIKRATNKINDKNNENQCEEEPTELSMQEKLLNIDKNIAFIVALDLIIAGVDSVTYYNFFIHTVSITKTKTFFTQAHISDFNNDRYSLLFND